MSLTFKTERLPYIGMGQTEPAGRAVAVQEYVAVKMKAHHFTVTLPAVWVRALGVEDGTKLLASVMGDGSVVYRLSEESA